MYAKEPGSLKELNDDLGVAQEKLFVKISFFCRSRLAKDDSDRGPNENYIYLIYLAILCDLFGNFGMVK